MTEANNSFILIIILLSFFTVRRAEFSLLPLSQLHARSKYEIDIRPTRRV